MTSYKLTYFNVRARGETTRLLFIHAGVPFEDVRVEFDDWPPLKEKMPFNQLPILEIGGNVTIPQSMAIARYVAKETGQYGKNALDSAFIDAVVYAVSDVFDAKVKAHFTKDEAQKEVNEKAYQETLKKTNKNLEKMLDANKDGNGFFVGDSATLADIHFYASYEIFVSKQADAIDDGTPKLKALYNKVADFPKIKKYIAGRQETFM